MEYSIISEFDLYGKHFCTIRVGQNVHVMEDKEIRKICGYWDPKRWKKKVSA